LIQFICCNIHIKSYLIVVKVEPRFIDDLQLHALIRQFFVMIKHENSAWSLVIKQRVAQLILTVFGIGVVTGDAAKDALGAFQALHEQPILVQSRAFRPLLVVDPDRDGLAVLGLQLPVQFLDGRFRRGMVVGQEKIVRLVGGHFVWSFLNQRLNGMNVEY